MSPCVLLLCVLTNEAELPPRRFHQVMAAASSHTWAAHSQITATNCCSHRELTMRFSMRSLGHAAALDRSLSLRRVRRFCSEDGR